MKQRLLKNWTPIRVMYLLMGLAMVGYSINEQMWAGVLFGAYFASMGLFAFGCAGGQCFTPPPARERRPSAGGDAVFEEVK